MNAARRLEESDEELMRRAQFDEAGAFAALYDRYAARAFRVARAVCHSQGAAEDAVQDGFLSIWRSRASFRPGQGSFAAWSMTLVRNRATDALRRETAANRPSALVLEEAVADPSAGTAEKVIARDQGAALRASLARLPDAQAEVITLAFFGGLTHQEIAAQLSLPEGTVKGRMRLGLAKLRRETR